MKIENSFSMDSLPWTEIIGFKLSSFIAGLAGAVASLTYQRHLTFKQACVMLITGAVCAMYLTPIVTLYINMSAEVDRGASFVIGLISMKIVEGLMSLGSKFARNPLTFLKRDQPSEPNPSKRGKTK